jgi:hypothetical protein
MSPRVSCWIAQALVLLCVGAGCIVIIVGVSSVPGLKWLAPVLGVMTFVGLRVLAAMMEQNGLKG